MHAVVFTKNNARLISYESLEDLKEFSNVVIAPDLTHATGFPPHFWKFEDGVIKGMTEAEQELRKQSINDHGLDNDPKAKASLAYELELKKKKDLEQNQKQAELKSLKDHVLSVHQEVVGNLEHSLSDHKESHKKALEGIVSQQSYVTQLQRRVFKNLFSKHEKLINLHKIHFFLEGVLILGILLKLFIK